ncbi:MAG: S-layer protein sap precursor [Firmicutes bacterium ADurb.Bin193]|nr:MAG: S-layer protein sap precursor [Firmicutes bacterium ADurb.Bin193]
MNLKGFIATTLAVVMLIGTVTIVHAGTFPDVLLRHSWAEPYIEEMVDRGLLKGYTDGTFKPDNPISKLEAVILSARILGVNNEENADFVDAALAAYEKELSGYDTPYKREAAYLLYWNALKVSELADYIGKDVRNTAMKRFEVAVLLTKVMGGEDEALSNTMVVLDYTDDSQIPAASKAYVKYVSESGIMKGMEKDLFMPLYEVTRAMMATMMYRAEEAMGIDAFNVVVSSVSAGSNRFFARVDGAGRDEEFILTPSAIINIDGKKGSLNDIKTGDEMRVYYQGEKIRLVETLTSRRSEEKSGVIGAIANNSGIKSISITPTGSLEETLVPYVLADNCSILIDNKDSAFTDLRNNYYVKLGIKGGKVISIVAETKEITVYGTITEVKTSGDIPAVIVKLDNDSYETYEFLANAIITRNGAVDEYRNLGVGDRVEIVLSAGRVKRLAATSINKTIEGTIEEIVISSSPSITISSGGVTTKCTVVAGTKFIIDDTEGTIYDIRLGAKAKIDLKSDNIDNITVSKTIIPSQITGIVTAVNTANNVLVINAVDPATGETMPTTVIVKSNVNIIDNTTTKVSTLKGLTAGRAIIALGAIDNYGTYSVNTIIITQ